MRTLINIPRETAARSTEHWLRETRVAAVLGAVLLPHAPVLVPAVARGSGRAAAASTEAMSAAAGFVMKLAPESMVVVSPHSPRKPGAFGLWSGERIQGTFARFNAPRAQADLPNDPPLIKAIMARAPSAGVETWLIPHQELDHGALVPLWFLARAGWAGPTVVVSLNYPEEGGLAAMGGAIRAAAGALGRRVVIVASGDMSHRLSPDAPAGFHPDARLFDQAFLHLLESGDYRGLEHIEPELREHAAEDVLDPTLVAAATADWNAFGHRLLSYEAPFGVGYGVAVLFSRPAGEEILTGTSARVDLQDGSQLPALARRAVATSLDGSFEFPPEPAGPYLNLHRGVFVTLHDLDGQLRGCVGTVAPACANLVAETWRNARLAAFHDNRFAPVAPAEMPDLRFEVSVLHPPERISGPSELDPGRYGIIVSTEDGRRGLLLPNLPPIRTPEQQLRYARAKGLISPREPVAVQRFDVDHFTEPDESKNSH